MHKYALIAVSMLSCVHIPVNPRAVESNEMCASALADGNYSAAKLHCFMALELAPSFVDAKLNMALIELSDGKYADALGRVTEVLRDDPINARGHNIACYIQAAHIKDFVEAEARCRSAIRINPAFIDARFKLGQILAKGEKYKEALEQFEIIEKLNPRIADAKVKSGQMLVMMDNLVEAQIKFQEAVEMDESYEEAWVMLGVVQSARGKFCDAEDTFLNCSRKITSSKACYQNALEVGPKCGT